MRSGALCCEGVHPIDPSGGSPFRMSKRTAVTTKDAELTPYRYRNLDSALPKGGTLTFDRTSSPTVDKRAPGVDLHDCAASNAAYRRHSARGKMSAVF
jgi:hypothetical protein